MTTTSVKVTINKILSHPQMAAKALRLTTNEIMAYATEIRGRPLKATTNRAEACELLGDSIEGKWKREDADDVAHAFINGTHQEKLKVMAVKEQMNKNERAAAKPAAKDLKKKVDDIMSTANKTAGKPKISAAATGAKSPTKNASSVPAQAPAKGAKPEKTGDKPVGRNAYSGMQLFPLKTENPRRPGSFGFESMKIIIDKPGITTEDFVAKGGRPNDLRWDIEHKNVEAKLPK